MSKERGFTLLEMLIAVAILSVLLGTAAPNFRGMLMNSRLTTANNELVASINLARSEAIKRGVRVTVCKSADGASCVTGGGWEQGWIVFTDNVAQDAAVTAGENLVRVHGALDGNDTLRGNGNLGNYLSYVATGLSQQTTGASQSGALVLCDSRGAANALATNINSVGRPSNAVDSGSDGIVNDYNGNNVTCS